MVEFSLNDSHQSIVQFLEYCFIDKPFRVFQLAGDASNRRYFRVVVEESSYVLMVWEPFVDDSNYPFLSVLSCFEQNEISVPKILEKSPQSGLILLEDLGDLTLERKFWENQDQSLVLPYYRQTLDELFKIHHLANNKQNSKCTAVTTEFDVAKFMWEFRYSMKHFVKTFCQISPSQKTEEELQEIFNDICERLLSQKKFVCHRDFHSRNVMINLGLVKIIDFQDARLGPVQYDLVSLLRDSYVSLNTKNQNLLLSEYFDRFSQQNPETSKEEFYLNYEIQTIQRCFKACGSFASFYNDRSDERYLKYIEDTIQTVKKSLVQFPEYSSFLAFLSDNGVFNRKFEVS